MKLTSLRLFFFSKDKTKKKNKSTRLISRSDPLSFGSTDSNVSSSDGHISLRDQSISKQELEAILRRLDITEDEVADMLTESSMSDGYDTIKIEQVDEAELREVFGVFDADGDGRISAEELHEMLVMLGDEQCSLNECRRMIRLVDRVGGGFVCFDDFVRMMDSSCR